MSINKRKKRKSVSKRKRNNQIKADYNSLEQRLALTTFVVTSLGDGIANDGLVTLREAIVAANTNAASGDAAAGESNGDMIRFDASLAGGVITLTQGQLTISDDVAIQGGSLDITINADEQSRAFEVTSSETVSLGRINVLSGRADNGAAVRSTGSGRLAIFGGRYGLNTATGDGGAIFSEGDLVVYGGATFTGNIADGNGGAIFSEGDTRVFGESTFNLNFADGDGGAIYSAGDFLSATDGASFTLNAANDAGRGGAIFNAGGTGIVEDVSFVGNSAASGGAVEVAGGQFFLTDINASANLARAGSSASTAGRGGAVHVTAADVVLVADSEFSTNSGASEGGGISAEAGTRVFVNDTVFNLNRAGGGGAIFNNGGDIFVNGSDFDTNFISTDQVGGGAAILSTNGRVLVNENSTFTDNISRNGGAVEIVGGEFFDTGSTYTNNTSVREVGESNGGAVSITGATTAVFNGSVFSGNQTTNQGGAIFNGADARLFLTDVEFSDNSVDDSLFEVANEGSDVGGGAIFNDGGNIVISNSLFDANSAISTTTTASGGAIVSVGGRVLIRGGSKFDSNFDTAVVIRGGELFDTDSQFSDNAAAVGGGGAISVENNATASFTGTSFFSNTSETNGGGLRVVDASLFLTDVLISENVASDSGGGIYNSNGRVFATDSSLVDNNAENEGGGIASIDGITRFNDSNLRRNQASGAGGGGLISGGRAFFEDGASINDNESSSTGGGLEVTDEAVVTLSFAAIVNNTAELNGGGLRAENGTVVLLNNNSPIAGNVSDSDGGGIFNEGFLSAVDAVFSGNSAENDGGAVYTSQSGRTQIENSSLFSNAATNGAAVFNAGNTSTLGSSFTGGRASETGGAIFTAPNAVTTIGLDNFFENNTPDDQN